MHTPEHIETTPAGFPILPGTPTTQDLLAREPITSDALSQSPELNITPPSPLTIPDVSSIPEPEKAPEQITGFEESLKKLESFDVEGKISERTEQAERDLLEINKRIKLHQAEALKGQEEALQRGETLGFATGEAARVNRENAIEAIRLSAIAEAMQGNVTLAQKQAERAVKAEFEEQERDIRTKRNNLIANYDSFTGAEKKRADALLQQLDAEDAFVKERKAQRQQIENIAIQAAFAQAPNTILEQIRNASDAVEAARLAAPYLQEEETSITTPGITSGETTIGDIQVSDATLNILQGGQSLSSLTPTTKTQVTTELRKLGFYSSETPQWFKDSAQQDIESQRVASTTLNGITYDQFGHDMSKVLPQLVESQLNELWEQARQEVIKGGVTTTSSSSNEVPSFEDL